MLKSVKQERFSYTPHGTLSTLTLPSGLVLYTVEPPWNDNESGISCIPEDIYTVTRNRTGRFQFWEVLNVPDRSNIEIHPANYFINPNTNKQELHGCIAPGLYLNQNHIASVSSSRSACNKMAKELGDDDWELHITQVKGAKL